MKRMLAAAAAGLALAGCIAHVTPGGGVYIEPLTDFIFVGPPVVVAPPPSVAVQPLPPVTVVPERYVYFYGGLYYYLWGSSWYWSNERRGPWHDLPRGYYPPRVQNRGLDRRGSGGGGIRRR